MMNTADPCVIDTDRLLRAGGQRGSNVAGIYADDSGRRYYVKTLESPAHTRNEWLAPQLRAPSCAEGAPTRRT